MDDFQFEGMTSELRAYLEFKGEGNGVYQERKRLRSLIQPGLLLAYYRASKERFFIPENEDVNSRSEKLSPTGKYKLVTTPYRTKPNSWSYSQGKVIEVQSGKLIGVVNRNYGAFPFLFVEGHPNGHNYLVCGEDYQGQTVIELDSGKRRDFIPKSAEDGGGFCWAEYRFDAATSIMTVSGCIWACPYEFRFYDFSNPMDGWPEIACDKAVDEDPKWPMVQPDGTVTSYQTTSTQQESQNEEIESEDRQVVATLKFKREGLHLVLLEEWVSDGEQKRRNKQKEDERKYVEWLDNFRATDPLYSTMKEYLKDPLFSCDQHDGVGTIHEGWSPDFKGTERRMCRRIMNKRPIIIDLEWGIDTAPIKLIVYKNGEHAENKWFEHSVSGMNKTFRYAKALLTDSQTS